jgi:predicted flavoprotein YhiN
MSAYLIPGVKLKTEADGRVFPSTDKSQTIKTALEDAAKDTGVVDVNVNNRVVGIEKDEERGQFRVVVDCSQQKEQEVGNNSNNKSKKKLAKAEDKEKACYFDRIIAATGSSKAGHNMMAALGQYISNT